MTKRKKTIMWSTIACLLVAGLAGTAVGVTYARFSSTGTGKGTATIAYWDVAVNPFEESLIKTYASPSPDTYAGGDEYDASYARTSTSDLMLAATVTNSGNVDALVKISQTGGFGYELREGVTSEDDTAGYLTKLDSHFSVKLFQSNEGNLTSDTDLEDLSTFTLTASETAYIYCEVLWTSDIETCFGSAADAFDTWIGTNVDYLTFTLAYTAIQTEGGAESESEEETESGSTTDPDPDPEDEDENHLSTDGWTALNSSNIDSVITNAGQYYLSENITVSSTLTLASGTTLCLNGHTLTGSSLNPLINVTTGNVIVEDCIGNGEITGANTAINVASGATLTLEGKPVISSNTTNVYLASGAYISLGELEEGANIGVTSATSITDSSSVQITSTETNTYNYESAIKYIHSDNSNYKVAASHSGYLHLIGKEYINVTFAVEGTNDSKPSNTPSDSNNFDGNYYIEGFDGNWNHVDGDYLCTEALSEYKGSAHSYDIYYDMGLSETTTSINFVISPYKWQSDMGGFGLGPSGNLTDISWGGSYNNFNLYATQASYVYVNEGEGAPYDYYNWANWKLDFGSDYSSENGMKTILEGIGDFTIVLQVDFNSVTTVWEQVNNIVSGVYFIADGQKISLV